MTIYIQLEKQLIQYIFLGTWALQPRWNLYYFMVAPLFFIGWGKRKFKETHNINILRPSGHALYDYNVKYLLASIGVN